MVDTRRRLEVTVEEISVCLELEAGIPVDLQRTYTTLNRCYMHLSGRQPYPSSTDLEKV